MDVGGYDPLAMEYFAGLGMRAGQKMREAAEVVGSIRTAVAGVTGTVQQATNATNAATESRSRGVSWLVWLGIGVLLYWLLTD